MTSVAGIFDAEFEWKKEISVDAEGKGWLSRRAVARLAGVSEGNIRYWLDKLRFASEEAILALPTPLKPYAGQDFTGAEKLPDTLSASLIKHHAWTAKQLSEQAQIVDSFLTARSLREYCREVVGWSSPNSLAPGQTYLESIHQLLLKQQEQTAFLVQESKRTQAEMVLLADKQVRFHNAGNNHPGSKTVILNELDEDEPYDGGMTIPQWLFSQGITLPTTARNAMSRRAAQFYRVDKMKDPLKSGNNVVFYGKDLVYIELAYQSVTGVRY